MKNKCRTLFLTLAVVLCMTAFSVTAFAAEAGHYASDESGTATPPDAIERITVDTDAVTLPTGNDGDAIIEWDVDATEIGDVLSGFLSSFSGQPLTPDGNLTLIDDLYQVESYASDESERRDKQFITVQSKNGNYFYLVIDRSGDTENVYFMNLVDEADLMALMEDENGETTAPTCSCTDKCVVGAINTNCEVCRSNMSECTGKEPAPEQEPTKQTGEETEKTDDAKDSEKQSSGMLPILVLVLALAGGGALYWFKFRGKQPKSKGNDDLDDYDFGLDEDDTEEETEIDDADLMAEADDNKENNE